MHMSKHARAIAQVLLATVTAAAVTGGLASAQVTQRAAAVRHRAKSHALRRLAPHGVGGRWKLVFDDEFNGTSLNQSVWNNHNGWTNQNGVTDSASNISVSGGHLTMILSSPGSGAEIGTNSFALKVGEFAQARIRFAGIGKTIYNWPAFWVSGPNWPSGGESDVAEGLGDLTINYHSPQGADNTGTVSGTWAGRFHTFGILRGTLYDRIYWDGKLVRVIPSHDDGAPQTLLFTVGAGNTQMTGPAGALVVDYVRAWAHS